METSIANRNNAFKQKTKERKIGSIREVVFHTISVHGPITAQDVAKFLVRPINQVSGRITELKREFRIKEFGSGFNVGTDCKNTKYVIVKDEDERRGYTHAIAMIRAEHPPLMQRACIEEELAQGLGLANDSPYARPSIFNDEDEFATLTSMDAVMLQILYDPRLRPGMTLDEARPYLYEIAEALNAPQS